MACIREALVLYGSGSIRVDLLKRFIRYDVTGDNEFFGKTFSRMKFFRWVVVLSNEYLDESSQLDPLTIF